MSSLFLLLSISLGFSTACAALTSVIERDEFVWASEDTANHPLFIRIPVYMAVHHERLLVGISTFGSIDGPDVALAWLSITSSTPEFRPYPPSNQGEGCSGIKDVRGLEVDALDRLWVVDKGNKDCGAKIAIFNLGNDTVSHVHGLSHPEIEPESKYRNLHDIAVDQTPDGFFCYILNSNRYLIVFHLASNKSWVVEFPEFAVFVSLALYPGEFGRELYLADEKLGFLCNVSLSQLRARERNISDPQQDVIGTLKGKAHRMVVDAAGVLYAALNEYNPNVHNIVKWSSATAFDRPEIFYKNDGYGSVPLALFIDKNQYLWIIDLHKRNRLNQFKLLKTALNTSTSASGNSRRAVDVIIA